MRVVFITNIPAPYRVPLWNEMNEKLGDDFLVIFCSHREPNRKWHVAEMKFRHVFLKENYRVKKDNATYIHNNTDVWKHLKTFNPDIVITSGFNPTMLYGFIYCLIKDKKHIPLSDAWKMSEKHLSIIHKLIRKVIFRFSYAFVACSLKGKAYFQSYGLKADSIFISPIVNTTTGHYKPYSDREFDILFSGQFTERKNPMFFITVAKMLQKIKPDLKVLFLGDGPLRENMLSELKEAGINFDYPGYATQEQLPSYYANSKLFLFPTAYDAWGVVANESLASGTPVIVTPYAGCADELVLHNRNGYVLELDEKQWADHCYSLLEDEQKWNSFSQHGLQTVATFTHNKAANELLKACTYAYQQ